MSNYIVTRIHRERDVGRFVWVWDLLANCLGMGSFPFSETPLLRGWFREELVNI